MNKCIHFFVSISLKKKKINKNGRPKRLIMDIIPIRNHSNTYLLGVAYEGLVHNLVSS
jgi:hypothetical protein